MGIYVFIVRGGQCSNMGGSLGRDSDPPPPSLNNANLLKSYCKVRKYTSPREQKLSLAPGNFS